ncbi:hypothetical protein CHS0354_005617 [Potamilus streckersoni]|uniref:Uncharacterized protein n=1 Tax=Potamilus streckersoni TaxID=2493646 RepID=A0AAE0SJD6_9BIVA|nr:hypothetical protein CHS0354_005617 [Potamilus streckersoni]
MRQYIRFAGQHGILVFPTLWNAAVKQSFHHHLDGLVKSTAKLQSYIDNALVPMVMALKDEPSLGGWDIINEPEGEMISGEMNTDPCFDSRFLQNSGAGWAGRMYTIQEYLRYLLIFDHPKPAKSISKLCKSTLSVGLHVKLCKRSLSVGLHVKLCKRRLSFGLHVKLCKRNLSVSLHAKLCKRSLSVDLHVKLCKRSLSVGLHVKLCKRSCPLALTYSYANVGYPLVLT